MSCFCLGKRRIGMLAASLLVVAIIGCVMAPSTDSEVADPCSFTFTDNISGSFEVIGFDSSQSIEGGGMKYSCSEWTVVKITFTPKDRTVSCIEDWGIYSGDGSVKMTILKETAFYIMFTLNHSREGEGGITITPAAPTSVVKVFTWDELCGYAGASTGSENDVDFIIVDTYNSLAEMGSTQLVFNNSVTVVANSDDSNVNGFKKVSLTKINNAEVPTILISSGSKVKFNGVTFDGGAVWINNPIDVYRSVAESTLQRGSLNSNANVNGIQPFIRNEGELYLTDDVVFQNINNTWDSHLETNGGCPGGAVYSKNYVELDGVLIKDCYAKRGSAVYCPTITSSQLMIKGNTILTHNGGADSLFGSVIYSYGGGIWIQDGKINENVGAYIIACKGQFRMDAGEICRNKSMTYSYSDGQLKYCGTIYMFEDGTSFVMNGGFIMDNVTMNSSASTGSGFCAGLTFQRFGTLNMSGGTICNNSVDYSLSSKIPSVSCDVVFATQNVNQVGLVIMSGGSLESVYMFNNGTLRWSHLSSATSTSAALADKESVTLSGYSASKMIIKPISVKYGTTTVSGSQKVHHIYDSNGTELSYRLNDVVTDMSGYIYLFDCDGWTASTEGAEQLVGKPVIDGDTGKVGSTLTVLFAQTNKLTYIWYSVEYYNTDHEKWNQVSTDTAYVVKGSDIGNTIVVVVTGTSGYTGSISSSEHHNTVFKVYYDVDCDIYNKDGAVDKVQVFFNSTSLKLPYSIEDKQGYVFAGWRVYVGGTVYTVSATGSSISVNSDLHVSPNWIPEDQYKGTLVIGSTTSST